MSVPDPDEKIKHRQLRYKCQTWFVNNGGKGNDGGKLVSGSNSGTLS